jgi:hypothetical protein
MRPKWPIASSRAPALSPTTCAPFQKPNAACSLNDAMLQRIPSSYMKCGNDHFTVSSTSGHAACTTARRCVRMGFAKSADFSM